MPTPAEIAQAAAARRKMQVENLQGVKLAAREKYRALRERAADQSVAAKLAEKERELIRGHYNDLFPTPRPLAERMAAMLDLHPGMSVLEPSAGTGRLVEACLPYGVFPVCVEWSYDAYRFICEKYPVGCYHADFMEWEPPYIPDFDRVIMNPPFSNGCDIDHVRRAHFMLKDGGILVAIMGEGAFFRNDRRGQEFRAWLDSVRGTSEKLPDGTFNQSGTGVNTRLVVIHK